MSTARVSAPSLSLRARSRTPVEVRAVALPPKGTGNTRATAANAMHKKDTSNQQEAKQQVQPPPPKTLLHENLLHNSFYLPYHCVYQNNVVLELPGTPKTRDAFDSAWSDSGYL